MALESEEALVVKVREQDVPVTFDPPGLEDSFDSLKQMTAFKDWCNGIDEDFVVKSIQIQSIDVVEDRVGFVKFKADITDKNDISIPAIVFLRGPIVGVFVLITCEEDKKQYTLLTVQPRMPTGKYLMLELPAGMLDDSGEFVGLAASELKQETGLAMQQKDLYDLTEKAFGSQWPGVYPNPGGCDECIRLCLYRARMSKEQIESLQSRCNGVLEDGEKIKLKVISVHELWRATPEVKALSALCIYENLVARRELPADGLPPSN